MRWRMASTAAWSPPSLSPRPTHRPAAMAAASVTRTSSRARLRSRSSVRRGWDIVGLITCVRLFCFENPDRPDVLPHQRAPGSPESAIRDDGVVSNTAAAPAHRGRTTRDMVVSLVVLLIPMTLVVLLFRLRGGEDAVTVDPATAISQAQASGAF